MDKIITEAMRRALIRPIGKVDWSNSAFRKVKKEGKNAVADFGEFLYEEFSNQAGDAAKIIRKGHDVRTTKKKTEVKTAFKNKGGTYFFNQIYYKDAQTGKVKDWDTLAFVFVSPNKVEIYECPRPTDPSQDFRWNNGWSWNRSSPKSLSDKWTKVYEGFV
jgi:hypothetical protein